MAPVYRCDPQAANGVGLTNPLKLLDRMLSQVLRA
ncbi:hypothetical protein Pla123a_25090 [Posidoniimonas polymericola]|uniref:Uncharacterized protein n=1 Tax=Posidoniimonas polymericola TaxID=2528002 RepID=A0A5C5YQF9_9BACT|nr:hypothetical protein Pla123a_25090 [Posidoniimonas polymericola]